MVGRLRPAHPGVAAQTAGRDWPLPGVVALHDHGGYKFRQGEDRARPGRSAAPSGRLLGIALWRARLGQCAGAGRISPSSCRTRSLGQPPVPAIRHAALGRPRRRIPCLTDGSNARPHDIGAYNFARRTARAHPGEVLHLLGTTFAGVISHEDRIAVNYLRTRATWTPNGSGASGCRAAGRARRCCRRPRITCGQRSSWA